MKKLIPLFFLLALIACCKREMKEIKKDRLYFVSVKINSSPDTTYIDTPELLPENKQFITRTSFCNREPFCGIVTKYSNDRSSSDGNTVIYQTEDLGIVYELNTS